MNHFQIYEQIKQLQIPIQEIRHRFRSDYIISLEIHILCYQVLLKGTTWDVFSGHFFRFSFINFLRFDVAIFDLVHDVEAINDLC